MLSDDPGEFASQLMAAGLLGPPSATPWRAEIERWPPPWRVHWGVLANGHQEAGMSWRQAEEEAYREMLAMRANPRPPANRKTAREPAAMPAMPRRKPRKAVREELPSMFDGMTDGSSTTYTGEI